MRKRSATAAEKRHLARLVDHGCIVCLNEFGVWSHPEIHHPRALGSMGKKAEHKDALPLCPRHHRTGGHGVALHAGQKTWESNFGSELDLLAQLRENLGINSEVDSEE